MIILRVDPNKQMSHARTTSNYIARGLEFSFTLVPTPNFQNTKWSKPRIFSQGSVSAGGGSPFLTSSRLQKEGGVFPAMG